MAVKTRFGRLGIPPGSSQSLMVDLPADGGVRAPDDPTRGALRVAANVNEAHVVRKPTRCTGEEAQ
jgi:hypothetical protein